MMFVALFLLSLSLDARGATATAGSRAAAGDAADAGAPTPGGVEYCVVGAGPGGLQAAAMLREAGRDVVVFDKSDKAGSFFARFPIHRRLISINKRHFATYHHEPEFQLRHDWNSLISLRGGVPPGLNFQTIRTSTTRTRMRWWIISVTLRRGCWTVACRLKQR